MSIVTAADERYAVPLSVMAASALTRLDRKAPVELHVLDAGMTKRSVGRLERVVAEKHPSASLRILRPDLAAVADFQTWPRLPRATYIRLLTPDLLGPSYDKAIYLDPDMVVLRDLARLWEIPVHGHPLGAVQDFVIPYIGSRGELPTRQGVAFRDREPYFNAGLMVMNLAWWREHQATDKLLKYLREFGDRLRFLDQDALNAVFCGQWKRLDLRWNRAPQYRGWRTSKDNARREQVEKLGTDLDDDPYIVHFVGREKPWSLGSKSPDRKLFYRELKASGVLTGLSRPAWQYGSRIGHELLLHTERLRGAVSRWMKS